MKLIKILLIVSIVFASCEKFVEPGPPATQISTESLFSTDAAATGAMFAVYTNFESGGFFGNLAVYTGLTSDEMALATTSDLFVQLHKNNIVPGHLFVDAFWSRYYQQVYRCNQILNGIATSKGLTDAVSQQLEGEALFARAFCFFHLTNLFGDIPLPLTPDYTVNASLPRVAVVDVYKQIEQDVMKAEQLLAVEFKAANNSATTERTRPNRAAATAFLAKVHLYMGDWVKSATEASTVIAQTTTYELATNLVTAFQKNNKEHIWQIHPISPSGTTQSGGALNLTGPPAGAYLDNRFVALYERTDKRRSDWMNYVRSGVDTFYYSNKYKGIPNSGTITDYTSVIRLGELYLIRAEALAMQNKTAEAEADLNRIRTRAGIQPVSGLSKPQFLDSLFLERQRELFTEHASRWFDLKRSGRINSVLSSLKGTNWVPTDALFPVPVTELARNPKLVQNPGY